MQLKTRYILLVNVVILIATAVFFVADDYRLRTSHIEATTRGTAAGIRARKIVDRITAEIQSLMDPATQTDRIREELRTLPDYPDVEGVMDVKVTFSLAEPKVVASMTGEAEGTMLRLNARERELLAPLTQRYVAGRSNIVVGMQRHKGLWATRVIAPYIVDADVRQGLDTTVGEAGRQYTVAVGLIEVLLDSRELPAYWRSFRLLNLGFLLLLAFVLTVFVDMATDRMVLRPLERLTQIVRRAEKGEVESNARFPDTEVGRVSASLTQMLATMKRLHAERVENLERLASGVAHEIRNPLHGISLSAQYLKDLVASSDLPTAQKEDAEAVLRIVLGEVKELNRIVNQFLDLRRPRQIAWTSEDIHDVLDRVVQEFALPLKDSAIRVSRRYDRTLPPLALDVVRMRTALYNLVQNAIQAMPTGGGLTLTTRRRDDEALVEVLDTGAGMSPEVAARVFEPYFTTRARQGGIGLGLTLAQQAVTAHGGRIEVRSHERAGTTFLVYLPLQQPPSEEDAPIETQ
jgi:signal transduction histidine kinase